MNMGFKDILVCFILHLGVLLTVTAELIQKNVIVGEHVVLPCLNGTDQHSNPTITWKYDNKDILKYMHSKTYKVDASSSYAFGDENKRDFSLVLPDPKEGIYTCIRNGRESTFDLKLWELIGSPSGYLPVGETLKLQLRSSGAQSFKIEWFNPEKIKVTGNEARWKLRDNNWSLQIEDLQVQDHGNWECHVLSRGLRMPYKVKVIGFLNPLESETMFAAVNSTVIFSCPLTINPFKISETVPETLIFRRMVKESIKKETTLINNSNDLPQKIIHKVQFEDAGRYQCALKFRHKDLNKTFNLVVMHVSKVEEALCCHISGPVLPMTQLCWISVNMSICNCSFAEDKFCYTPETPGLWRCSLKVENDVKISINYTVEGRKTEENKNKFPWTEVTIGAGILLFLLLLIMIAVCVVTSKSFKQKK
uniref:Ig-like domain-containing protein n=1 Tax=Salvator merianae TaxID=96440 RepID=A0A8D0E0C9_SALMN